jgi:hypothetical protein
MRCATTRAAWTSSVAQSRRDLLHHLVAARVAELAVDDLEIVEIDAEDRVAVPGAGRAAVLAIELLHEAPLVR